VPNLITISAILLGLIFCYLLASYFYRVGAAVPQRARAQFQAQRDRLLADFFEAASNSGKPRGLRWKSLDWSSAGSATEPVLARDRKGGEIVALLPVTIQFEAIPGSDMEGLPAVGNLRNASAVFFYQRGSWATTGKAVFNLNPDEAIAHFKDQYSLLEPPAPPAAGTP
jgi:hypothetical protein